MNYITRLLIINYLTYQQIIFLTLGGLAVVLITLKLLDNKKTIQEE